MYQVEVKNTFKKDIKLCRKRGIDKSLIDITINILIEKGKLSAKYKPHKLTGNYVQHWEAHIEPDLILIWLQDDLKQIITLARIGTHSDLFK